MLLYLLYFKSREGDGMLLYKRRGKGWHEKGICSKMEKVFKRAIRRGKVPPDSKITEVWRVPERSSNALTRRCRFV